MSLFPFITGDVDSTQATTTDLPVFREYAWDFENNCLLLKDGQMIVVEGNEALKVWCYKALNTPRYRYLAYSWNYGHELDNLVGSGWSPEATRLEAERYVREALTASPYIKDVSSVVVEFDGSVLKLTANVDTVYGEVKVNV